MESEPLFWWCGASGLVYTHLEEQSIWKTSQQFGFIFHVWFGWWYGMASGRCYALREHYSSLAFLWGWVMHMIYLWIIHKNHWCLLALSIFATVGKFNNILLGGCLSGFGGNEPITLGCIANSGCGLATRPSYTLPIYLNNTSFK